MQKKKEIETLSPKKMRELLSQIVEDCIEYGNSLDTYEDFGKKVIDSLREYKLVDYGYSKEQLLRIEFSYLADVLSDEQFIRICECVNYDKKELKRFNEESREYYLGRTVSSIFYDALTQDKIDKYIDEYYKFYHGISCNIDINDNKDIERD